MTADKIRILIVDDIDETRENLAKLIGFEPDMEIVGSAASGQQAIDLAKRERPHVILMDINMPDMDGITATEIIANTVPESPIIMMSVQNEQDYLRRSMLAGARELFGAARVPNGAYVVFALLTMSVLGAWTFWARARDEQAFIKRAFILAIAFTLLLSPRYAWYYVWLIPFICLLPGRRVAAACYLTVACFLLYHTWQHDTAHDQFVLNAQIILPAVVIAALVWGACNLRRTKQPAILLNEPSEGKS